MKEIITFGILAIGTGVLLAGIALMIDVLKK